MQKKKLVNTIGALLIIILGPLFIILTMDFSKQMSTIDFVLNIFIRFIIVYFVIAIPVHFITKNMK